MSNNEKITLIAAGDVVPDLYGEENQFDLVKPILNGAEIAFGQLESILSARGSWQGGEMVLNEPSRKHKTRKFPEQNFSHETGGKLLADAGFNVMSFASNHAMRQSDEGMLDTLDVLRANDIVPVGAGRNIEEATRPAVFNVKGTTVGFLAYCSVVPRGQWATTQRAGVAPVRANTAYEQYDWQPGTPPHVVSWANEEDLQGMVRDIQALRNRVDVVVVSHHWGIHFTPAIIAQYQYQVGHAAIDAGADIVLGHHPHVLKGIEVYNGKPIFYSLANLKMRIPANLFPLDTGGRYATMLNHRFEISPEHTEFAFPKDAVKTGLVKCEIFDKKIQRVALIPGWIRPDSNPEPLRRNDPRSQEVMDYLAWLCREEKLATELAWEGDEIRVLLP